MTLRIFTIVFPFLLVQITGYKTAFCQPSSTDTICIDKIKYTAIVNGLIQLDLKDSLLTICNKKADYLDSISQSKDEIISGQEMKSLVFKDQINSQENTINLQLNQIGKLKLTKTIYGLGFCISAGGLLTILLLQ
jgi:hypothetical protein